MVVPECMSLAATTEYIDCYEIILFSQIFPKIQDSRRYTGSVGIYNSNELEIWLCYSNIMCGVIREVEKEGLVSVKHYLKVAYGTFRHQVSFNSDTTTDLESRPATSRTAL